MKFQQCPCCSGNTFTQCCEPLLLKADFAKSPEQLMRSRYSAFALGGFGEYLLNTWGAVRTMNLSEAELSERSVDWQGLEIVSHSQLDDNGHVEFKAVYLAQNQAMAVHHEKSIFKRTAGRWFYIKGEIID